MADVAFTGQMQTQLIEVQIAEITLGGHHQFQLQQCATALDRVIQMADIQWQDFGVKRGAELTGHAFDGFGFDRRIAWHQLHGRRALERIKLQHAEGGQRPHIVRPQ